MLNKNNFFKNFSFNSKTLNKNLKKTKKNFSIIAARFKKFRNSSTIEL